MSITILELKSLLAGTNKGASIDDITNFYDLLKRASYKMLAKVDPIETIRLQSLSQFVHDDLQNYSLPADYKKIIDIANVENRSSLDRANRIFSEPFSAGINNSNKNIAIESLEGTKYIRINWKDSNAVTLHTMDSLTTNGTISAVGSATGLKANTQFKLSGSGSIEFDVVVSGDGIQNTTMTSVDLTNYDEIADIIIPVYLGSVSNITSFTFIFGNDLTTKCWTTVTQTTQADGTAFRIGWNYLLFPWSTATETGTVVPSTIDSFKLTVQSSGTISNMRVDNILFSIGRPFDLKYYSQYIFKNSSGTWLSIPTSDTDTCILDGTALSVFISECILEMYLQMATNQGDPRYLFAKRDLEDTYQQYKAEYPSMSKKAVGSYWPKPRFGR